MTYRSDKNNYPGVPLAKEIRLGEGTDACGAMHVNWHTAIVTHYHPVQRQNFKVVYALFCNIDKPMLDTNSNPKINRPNVTFKSILVLI